ncbi:GNAT family N-acetyltransferase [Corynebacterium variabile]|uniref:GNAT family N-acetyltransferase n=1 Tax=Corynebacterium variabile TaxID=1727 RepID=UPI0028971CE1|nr:GNAT family N-acetyltransferase [Corynebacterium variabile]
MPGAPSPVLSRLRTDLPATSVLPSQPPVPVLTGEFADFALRVASPSPDSADAALVAEWMSRPHLVETWEQPWGPERWAEDWRAKLATTYSVPLILSLRGEDIGYMEIYRPHRDEIGAVYASEPHDLGLHIAVGDPELVGQGIVGPMLGALPPALLDADPECRVVVGEPDHRNGRVHAVLRREGWIDRGERQQRPDRRVRLFLYGEDAATR